jgi:sigma-B regulation protein RsbU (phosphoserine phosphatase)
MKRNWKILAVDDEPGVLYAIERVLGSQYQVLTCESALESIELAKSKRPDIAIVDVRMPQMDGFDLMGALLSTDPSMKVILMTGSIHESDQKLARAIRERAFYYITKPFDRDVLLALVERCAEIKGLELADQLHTEFLRRQLASASAFQHSMLPSNRESLDGFEIRAMYHPCEHVAGDYYDYAVCGDGALSVLIADVVGHGASAAMLTAVVKSSFHRSRRDCYSPRCIVKNLVEDIAAFEADQFVTTFCATLRREKHEIEYVNAGHVDGLIVGPDSSIQRLAATGPFVSSLVRDRDWEVRTEEWPPDSQLLLHTDGVTEAWHQEEMYGDERLETAIRASHTRHDELLSYVYNSVIQHLAGKPPSDDLTLLNVWSK